MSIQQASGPVKQCVYEAEALINPPLHMRRAGYGSRCVSQSAYLSVTHLRSKVTRWLALITWSKQ